jgi:hypothetical protein
VNDEDAATYLAAAREQAEKTAGARLDERTLGVVLAASRAALDAYDADLDAAVAADDNEPSAQEHRRTVMAESRDIKPMAAEIKIRLARMAALVENADAWLFDEWPEASQAVSLLRSAETFIEKLNAHGRASVNASTGMAG